MARDGSSGGVIRLVTIDQSGVEKEVVLGERQSLMWPLTELIYLRDI
jgi:hypothetical protein